jgi:hypothetical protein
MKALVPRVAAMIVGIGSFVFALMHATCFAATCTLNVTMNLPTAMLIDISSNGGTPQL